MLVSVTQSTPYSPAEMLQDLPATVYKGLIEEHLSALEMKTLRLVSKECRFLVDTTVTALKPRDFSHSQVTGASLLCQVTE